MRTLYRTYWRNLSLQIPTYMSINAMLNKGIVYIQSFRIENKKEFLNYKKKKNIYTYLYTIIFIYISTNIKECHSTYSSLLHLE